MWIDPPIHQSETLVHVREHSNDDVVKPRPSLLAREGRAGNSLCEAAIWAFILFLEKTRDVTKSYSRKIARQKVSSGRAPFADFSEWYSVVIGFVSFTGWRFLVSFPRPPERISPLVGSFASRNCLRWVISHVHLGTSACFHSGFLLPVKSCTYCRTDCACIVNELTCRLSYAIKVTYVRACMCLCDSVEFHKKFDCRWKLRETCQRVNTYVLHMHLCPPIVWRTCSIFFFFLSMFLFLSMRLKNLLILVLMKGQRIFC